WYSDPIQHGFGPLQQFRHSAIFLGSKIDAELGAELAAMVNDELAERLPCGGVGGKRLVDIVIIGEGPRQGLRLRTSFANAKHPMRSRRRGHISHEGDSAEHQIGSAEIVDRCNERLHHVPDAIAKLPRQKHLGFRAHFYGKRRLTAALWG